MTSLGHMLSRAEHPANDLVGGPLGGSIRPDDRHDAEGNAGITVDDSPEWSVAWD